MVTYRSAWREALYGPTGFYRTGRGAGTDFRTSLSAGLPAGSVFAGALLRLAERVDRALGRPDPFDLVDVGAGQGALLAAACGVAGGGAGGGGPGSAGSRWRLTGVELGPRPTDLPARVRWQRSLPRSVTGLLVGVEWLDVVPCEVVRDGRVVQADGSLGGPPRPADRAWLDVWWPGWRSGTAEVGRYRDLAWSGALARLAAGVAIAVDYGHLLGERRPTLTGYAGGRQVLPRLDGGTDITAHVAVDSLRGRRLSQRRALARLGVDGRLRTGGEGRPAGSDLRAELERASAAAELLDPAGLGDFHWVLASAGTGAAGEGTARVLADLVAEP
ncbi:MAG: hypothetical protein ACYDB7_08605 [Mycobacteriales bacterium]